MKELIKITENENGHRAVSAKELYLGLGYNKSHWTRWSQKNIVNNKFAIENEDYVPLAIEANGNLTKDFALKINFAKKIAMKANTKIGDEYRDYFLKCEEVVKNNVVKALSPAEMFLRSAKMLVEQERKISEHDNRIAQLEAKATTIPEYYTIAGYGTLNGVTVNLKLASNLGRKASKLCKEKGLMTDECPDPRFGKVKMYPKLILEQVFNSTPLN